MKYIEEAPLTKPVKVEDYKYKPPADLEGKSLEELEAMLDEHNKRGSVPENKEAPIRMQQPKPAPKKVEKRPSMPMKAAQEIEKENVAKKGNSSMQVRKGYGKVPKYL